MGRSGRRLLAVAFTAALLTGACGGDADDTAQEPASTETAQATATAAPSPTPEPTATTEPTPEPTPTSVPVVVEEPVNGFTERTVVFSNVEYTATRAVVTNQELRSYAEGTEPVVDEGARHLVVDVAATNLLGDTLIGLGDEAVGLLVGDTRLPLEQGFLTDITGFVQPNSTTTGFLAFALADTDDPAAATVVFGAAPDRIAPMPLTTDVPDLGYPLITPLASAEAEATGAGPTNGGTLVFRLQESLVSIDLPHEQVTSPTGHRADEGQVFVRLHVRVEKTEGRGNDLLNDAFRLLVDGEPIAPFDVAESATGSNGSATAMPGAVVDAWVLFVAPSDAATLALQVGAFDDEPGVIPLEISLVP